MKLKLLTVMIVLVIAAIASQGVSANGYFEVNINPDKVSVDLVDYVLYVDLSLAPDDFWANTSCGDIRVFDSAGIVEMPREVSVCNVTAETGIIYTKVNFVNSSAVTKIRINYGNGSDYAVGDTYGANNVWSEKVVSHFDGGQLIDSSGNGNTPSLVNSPMLSGDVVNLNHTAEQYILYNNLVSGVTDFSVSIVVDNVPATPEYQCNNIEVTNLSSVGSGYSGYLTAKITNNYAATATITGLYSDWSNGNRQYAYSDWIRICTDGASSQCGSSSEEIWDGAAGQYTTIPYTERYMRPIALSIPAFGGAVGVENVSASTTTYLWQYVRDSASSVDFSEGVYTVCLDFSISGQGPGGSDLECNNVCDTLYAGSYSDPGVVENNADDFGLFGIGKSITQISIDGAMNPAHGRGYVTVNNNSAKFNFGFNGTQVISSEATTNLRDGQKHLVTFSWDDSTNETRVYIDGVNEVNHTGVSSLASVLDTNVTLGAFLTETSGGFFNGDIDEFRFSESVVSASEVAATYENVINPSTFYNVTVPGPTPPLVTNFDGETTDFSSGSDNVSQPVLEKTAYGKIVWDSSNLDFIANDFDSYVTMGDGWISVDSANLGADVNTSAQVTFYGGYTLPVIYADGEVCTSCSFVSSGGGEQVFNVPHFTNYTVQNGTNITSCGVTINLAGDYQLVNNVTGTGVSCINVTVSGVSIDGQGYTINGTNLGVYYSANNAAQDAVIENTVMTLSPTGVAAAIGWSYTGGSLDVGNVTFRNNTVYGGLAHYVYDGQINSEGFHVYDNVFERTGTAVGIFLDLTTTMQYLYLSNNTIRNFPTGFRKVGNSAVPKNVVVNGNIFENISSYLVSDDLGGMWIYNNNFTDVARLFEGGSSTTVVLLNTTEQAGTNIIGGSTIGGNYWSTNNGCLDVARDGVCDVAYQPESGVYDYLSLTQLRSLFSGATNVTSPEQNDAVRGENVTVTVVLTDTNYERIYINNSVGNVVNGSNLTTYEIPVVSGDDSIYVGSVDVSGGLINWTQIDLRVSNLGVITGQTTDKGVYWITNEDPQVSWSLTGVDGYGALTSNLYLMNGSTVVASKLGVTGSVGSITPGIDFGGDSTYPRAQTFLAQGDTLTHMDNIYASGTATGCPSGWNFYEGSNPASPGAYLGHANVTTVPGTCGNRVLVDIPDISGFVKDQSYIAYAVPAGSDENTDPTVWNMAAYKGFYNQDPLVAGFRYRTGNWESNFELPARMTFVDNANYNVSFNESVTTSYETAHFKIDVTDTVFNETDNTTGVVADAMTIPVVTAPSTEQNGDFNVTWTVSSQSLGIPVYTVQQSLDGGAFTFVNTTTDAYLQITADFEGNVTYQVKAEDDYVNTTYDNGTEFQIILSPSVSSRVCALTYPNEDNLPTIAKLPVNFSVYAPLGFTSPSAEIRLKLGGNTYVSTECTYAVVDSTHRDYSCNVSMNYWYGAGDYDLNITFTDAPKEVTTEYAGECEYGQLVASKQSISVITFPDAGPGITNTVSNTPVTVRNTGNVPIDLKMTAYDLSGRTNPSSKLPATAFKAGASIGTSVVMADSTQKNLSMTIEPASGAEDDVWMWLSMPTNQLIQDYYSATAWQVVGTG